MTNRVTHLQLGNVIYNLSDIHTSDFASITDPTASIKSCQDAIIAILNILRGFEDYSNALVGYSLDLNMDNQTRFAKIGEALEVLGATVIPLSE